MYRVKRKCQNLDGKITDFQKSKEKRKKKNSRWSKMEIQERGGGRRRDLKKKAMVSLASYSNAPYVDHYGNLLYKMNKLFSQSC